MRHDHYRPAGWHHFRAGIGVDNVDIPAASKKGVIVMNTPFGNSITTAEHAVALMFALARQLQDRVHIGRLPVQVYGDHSAAAGCDMVRELLYIQIVGEGVDIHEIRIRAYRQDRACGGKEGISRQKHLITWANQPNPYCSGDVAD